MDLARWADQVTVLVRGESLADSMSDYLIREINAAPNVGATYRVEVAGGTGTDHLESLVLKDRGSGTRRIVPADALFVLIGSQPRAEWLGDSVARDQWGFILTGPDLLGPPDSARRQMCNGTRSVPSRVGDEDARVRLRDRWRGIGGLCSR